MPDFSRICALLAGTQRAHAGDAAAVTPAQFPRWRALATLALLSPCSFACTSTSPEPIVDLPSYCRSISAADRANQSPAPGRGASSPSLSGHVDAPLPISPTVLSSWALPAGVDTREPQLLCGTGAAHIVVPGVGIWTASVQSELVHTPMAGLEAAYVEDSGDLYAVVAPKKGDLELQVRRAGDLAHVDSVTVVPCSLCSAAAVYVARVGSDQLVIPCTRSAITAQFENPDEYCQANPSLVKCLPSWRRMTEDCSSTWSVAKRRWLKAFEPKGPPMLDMTDPNRPAGLPGPGLAISTRQGQQGTSSWVWSSGAWFGVTDFLWNTCSYDERWRTMYYVDIDTREWRFRSHDRTIMRFGDAQLTRWPTTGHWASAFDPYQAGGYAGGSLIGDEAVPLAIAATAGGVVALDVSGEAAYTQQLAFVTGHWWTANTLWSYPEPNLTAAIYDKNGATLLAAQHELVALDANGQLLWRDDMGWNIARPGGVTMCPDGVVWVVGLGGQVVALGGQGK